MASIILAEGASGDLKWTLTVSADKVGEVWRGRDLEVRGKNANGDFLAAKAVLQTDVEIPAILVKDDARLKTREEIEADLTDAIKVARAEVIRRFSRIEVEWAASGEAFFGVKQPFGQASGALVGYARIHLAQLLGPDAQADALPIVELVLFGVVTAMVDAGAGAKTCTAAIGAVVVLRRAVLPTFRIDLDDFNVGLPEFSLPDLRVADKLPLVSLNGVVRAFERLFKGLGITVDVKSVNGKTPQLLLTDLAGTPKWAIVEENTTTLQPFEVTVKLNGTEIFKIENLTAGYDGNDLKINGTLVVQQPVTLNDGAQDLGPLRLSWKGVKVTAILEQPVSGGSGPYFAAKVEFAMVTLSSRDEPDVTLGLRGTVLLSPNGIKVVSLEVLVGVDPLKLLVLAQRLGSGVLQILSSCKDQNLPNVLPKLLRTLARLAAAAARAIGFVGEIIGNLLVGIARAIGTLIEGLAKLLREAGDNLVFEIRMTVDPIEILQVVVTARDDAGRTTPAVAEGLGLRLSIPAGWQPAVLVDFVAQPGVYLLAVPNETEGETIAELSTDLWLKQQLQQQTSVSPVRDADKDTGDRGAEPLLKLTVKRTQRFSVVIAGVRHGDPLFLHRIVTPPPTVMIDGQKITVCPERLVLEEIKAGLDFVVDFQPRRVLALLGLGDTGEPSGTGFLDNLKQVIWIEKLDNKEIKLEERTISMDVELGVRVAGVQTNPKLKLRLSLNDLSVAVESKTQTLDIKGEKIDRRALGLQWVVEPGDDKALFQIEFKGASTTLQLHTEKNAKMELRYTDLSGDGRGLVFNVTMFRVGRGGLDMDASISDQTVRLNGLDVPFRFTTGALRIRGGRLVEASVAGKGKLPPQLVGDAGASVALTFTQRDDGTIELQSGAAKIDKAGEPIVCHATRFTLTITNLGIDFVRENGQVHFYFVVTGSLQFTPKKGEFESGLLQYLKDVRMNLDKVPLAGDARVLAQHINFQIALKPKLRVNLFDLFSFELRGIGFHPSAKKFGGKPAMNVSGQIAFADIGDVIAPKIDFHGLWIAPPADGQSLPRIKADGLGVDIGLPGSVRLAGTVVAVDERITTIEGTELVPPEYKTYGFLGDGRLALDGFATMSASFGFLEVKMKEGTELRKSFFLFVQQERIAIEIPTPIWTLYMREVGFGFGYRYTLEGIKAAEGARSVAELIRTLDEVSKRQGELASFAAWRPDPEKENFTLALRGAIQFAPAEKKWDEKKEEETPNPFLFDLVAALRSDMTFLMSVRGWPFTNYLDFSKNTKDLRTNPFFLGYLYISAPRQEFLARFLTNRTGHIGNTPPVYPQLEAAMRAVDFSATLYIRPGLLHYELGWPDQLKVTLFDDENLRADVRGGMIFRVWDQAMLTGYNIEANAFLRIRGQAGGDSLGVAAEGSLSAVFVARFIAHLDFATRKYLFYGLASLDASIVLSISAWLRVDLRFTKFTIRIGFSFSIQLSIALELAISDAGFGARADVRVAISVFGATLSVRVGFTLGGGQLAEARARVARFMAMSLTADAPEPSRVEAAARNDKALESKAEQAKDAGDAPVTQPVAEKPKENDLIGYAALGMEIPATDFWLVLRNIGTLPASLPANENLVLAMLVPRDGRFFAGGNAGDVTHQLKWTSNVTAHRLDPGNGTRKFKAFGPSQELEIKANLKSSLPEASQVTLRAMLDACFLIDAKVGANAIAVTRWTEPATPQLFARSTRLDAADEPHRVTERGATQTAFNAQTAKEGEIVTAVRDARTTLLSLFLEQFTALANTGVIPADGIHVADFGLVFAIDPKNAETFASTLTVKKSDAADAGNVALLNPPNLWFANTDPELKRQRHDVTVEGVRLDWDLDPAWADDVTTDPEHFLHHYEIVRSIEGRELVRKTFDVKPVATPGVRKGDKIELVRPDWQFSDDLSDLSEQFRSALLPRGGPDAAPAAAADWISLFGDDEEVTVTYVVTPVDIAGTRGLLRTIPVDIERPSAPVRPAVAELIVIAPRQALLDPRKPGDLEPPQNLKVYLGISDPHWDPADEPPKWFRNEQLGNDHILLRSYRLILDPDDIVPSGVFGGDGLTTRRRTPGVSDELLPTADEVPFADVKRESGPKPVWLIAPGDPLPVGLVIDVEERKKFPFWIDFVQLNATIRDRLWRRKDAKAQRVAIRVYFETVLEMRTKDGKTVRASMTSRRVPVEIELRVPTADENKPLAFRPAMFEWPVRVDYRPLMPGAVRARSGLAYFRGPARTAIGEELQLAQYLDPQRRSLTEVVWAAAPDAEPKQLVGGFDLFELDLDELAPSDTSGKPLEDDAKAWQRARRLARAHLLGRSAAMLTPGAIEDPTAWHAQMPSEVWRCDRSQATPKRRGSLPVRKQWYSPRESWLQWPANVPRQVLLERIDEELIDALMANGQPEELEVVLTIAGQRRPVVLAKRKICDHKSELHDLRGDLKFDGSIVKPPDPFKQLSPVLLRRALMCLATESGFDLAGAVLDLTATVKTKAVRVEIQNEASVKIEEEVQRKASRSVNLAADGALHPVLAETVDLLGWTHSTDGTIYRRYEVLAEPPAPLRAKDLVSFLNATDPEKDPYGWMALGAFGLAATIKLHDCDRGEFVKPAEVITRARRVFSDVLGRYKTAGGAPLLDVFLRPGRDRIAGDVDSGTGKPEALLPDDEALSFVQLSLRPAPLQSFKYSFVTVQGPVDAVLPEPQKLIGDLTMLRVDDGQVITLSKDLPKQTITLPTTAASGPIRLLMRHPRAWSSAEINQVLPATVVKTFDDPEDAEAFAELDTVYENGAFPELDPTVFSALADGDLEKRSLDDFRKYASRVPDVVVPSAVGIDFVTAYIGWMRRFLDHGLAPKQKSGFSICAPQRQQPWKLAAAIDGSVQLSFLHDDRFAHARAYAVRPVGRYHEQAVAVRGENAREEMEKLIARNAQGVKIGHAIAVAPRTARLEAPAFLSSRMVGENAAEWQLTLARHPEQDLVLSNRSLFARLAFEGVALSWVQHYPDHIWPEKLAPKVGDLRPDYTRTPPMRRPDASDLADAPRLTDTNLADAAVADPTIWKGAEIYRVPRLPHHLRATTLATARASAVVSSISYATQQDFFYRLPEGLRERLLVNDTDGKPSLPHPIDEPTWGLALRDQKSYLRIRFSALSYADLMTKKTFEAWVAKGDDVAFWPDPGVVCVLARLSERGSETIREDEAEVLGVVPERNAQTKLFALRARGPSWKPAPFDVGIERGTAPSGGSPLFTLTALLEMSRFEPRPVRFAEPAAEAAWQNFKAKAGDFVELVPVDGGGGVMRLLKLPHDGILVDLEKLGDDDSKKLVKIFRKLVADAVLDGAKTWMLRAEKGTATPQDREISSRWSKQ